MAGRKSLTPAQPGRAIQIVDKTPVHIGELEAAARDAGELIPIEEIDRSHVLLNAGRIQNALLMATVADRSIAESYLKIVESKAYVGAAYVDAGGNRRRVATLEEFCNIYFGKSARRCREIANNLELLGVELFEAAERTGLGQRDYNALKALPADDQEVIKQAIAEGGDRHAVLGMLTQLAQRQAVEKANLQSDIAAKNDVAAKKSDRINKLEEDLAKARRQARKATPDETLKVLRTRISELVVGIEADINAPGDVASLRRWVAETTEFAQANNLDVMPMLAGTFAQIERVLWCLRDEFSIPHAAVGDPETEADMALGNIG
jgi:hypothetical protein